MSTVSITAANPSAARRRAVVATEKTTSTNIELLPVDSALSTPAATSGAGEGRNPTSAGNARDISHHSIRGEAVLERSAKDLTPAKKSSVNGVIAGGPNSNGLATRRTRKPNGKAEKARWTTVLSIFAKNFALIVVLLGLVQLKVEVVNKKIVDEVGGLRKELSDKIDEKGAILESGLKKLEAKNDELERYLNELKTEDWLSKEEFEKIFEGLKNAKGNESNVGGLDEIREIARGMIEKELEKYAADGLGRVDYALASGGARVVKHSEPFDTRWGDWFMSAATNGVHHNAERMLKPSFGEPGQCFPLKGSSGFVQIKLRTAIIPEAVTLEHVAKNVAYDRSSAPKDCRVSGWLQGRNTDALIDTENMYLVVEFTYDLEKSKAQTFNVLNSTGSGLIDTVRLDFTSNHGSPHTCIYRFRVHGHEPDLASLMALQS
ncbi:PREDICTED: protein SAD1/UNC-84 domain protein 1-like isoform X2 [Lupinus angustifolius]|uniref:protein SAD1/UNC-84 domain protein 1-like isoform X2 n=1 Tax=Lupinus angustifolius TaxID=3871 RepID=UPI00092EB481|nr:PREDICTED: protein SAD1/UNC-84 domain protein 1-like isoform X2 [Lupinus angustifolius]